MSKGWWLLPSAIGGACIWTFAGWKIYEALQDSPREDVKVFASPSAAAPEPLVAQNDGPTAPSL